MEEPKKKKKKISLSTQLKNMRKERDEYYDKYRELHRSKWRLEKTIEQIEQAFPLKFYKIDFKMMTNSGHYITKSEIHESYTPQLAIQKLKADKTHPDTFELIDIKVLA